jgi:hypothetical protein
MSEREVRLVFRTVLVPHFRTGLSSQLPRAGCPFSNFRLRTMLKLQVDLDLLRDEGVQECLCSGCTFLGFHVACCLAFSQYAKLDSVKITSAMETY